jgi:NAD-dependent dihydropyrimidine dehydrogenase PreA subunit
MPVLINFKICDNSEDCSGIEVCPTRAFHWDSKGKTIAVDESKCILCGKCERACPVNAIRVAKSEGEYKRIRREIDEDPRKVSDLFVDRYGAQPIHPAFLIPQDRFDVQILKSTKLAAVELFNNDSIMCLFYSIPAKELFRDTDMKYRKMEVKDKTLLKRHGVKKLPALLFFKDGKMIGKIEGYHDVNKKEGLIKKIDKIIS